MKLEFWSATTTKTTLKWCHQFGSITGLWTRNPIATASIGMPGTAKNELDNIREEMGLSVKARKVSHMWTTWDRYVGRILDTRFESSKTRTSMNLESFDIAMDLYSYDMEMVVPISSDEYIQDKIGTNKCNEFGSSGGDIKKASKGQEGREIIKNSWSSKDKVKSGEYVLSRPPKKPGGKEADDGVTATTISLGTTSTLEKTSKTIINSNKAARPQDREPTSFKN